MVVFSFFSIFRSPRTASDRQYRKNEKQNVHGDKRRTSDRTEQIGNSALFGWRQDSAVKSDILLFDRLKDENKTYYRQHHKRDLVNKQRRGIRHKLKNLSLGGIFFSQHLVQLIEIYTLNYKRSNYSAEQIEQCVIYNSIDQPSCLDVDKRQDGTHERGISKLKEIAVREAEDNGGYKDRVALSEHQQL